MTMEWKNAFKNLGQALGGAVAVGVQQASRTPRKRSGLSVPVGDGTPRCTPCRANAMVQAAKKYGMQKK